MFQLFTSLWHFGFWNILSHVSCTLVFICSGILLNKYENIYEIFLNKQLKRSKSFNSCGLLWLRILQLKINMEVNQIFIIILLEYASVEKDEWNTNGKTPCIFKMHALFVVTTAWTDGNKLCLILFYFIRRDRMIGCPTPHPLCTKRKRMYISGKMAVCINLCRNMQCY